MMEQKRFRIFLVIILLGMSLTGACIEQDAVKGFLEGTVTIGPLCPVETDPPDPACQPTEETYKAWPVAIWSDAGTKVAQIEPDLNGAYRVELPEGNYVVDLEMQNSFGGGNLPANITIEANETTTLNIDIDTGIR